MKKVWEWLKKNWKWLVLPLWVASLVLVWLFHGGTKQFLPPSGTTDQAAADAMKAKDQALTEFRARLEEIIRQAEERLKTASKEQVDAFKELQGKPLTEVAAWIDKIS